MRTGETYGLWVAISPIGRSKWLCRCRCGTERGVAVHDLRHGKSTCCGCRMPPRRWPESKMVEVLLLHAEDLGRMPTSSELTRLTGDKGLGCAIARKGGFEAWADRLGLSQKRSATSTGVKWQHREHDFFLKLGFVSVEQSMKCPFDLEVNGLRVDVKVATHTANYVFAGLKNGKDCDYFDLLCLDSGEVRHRFIIPSSEARVTTLAISDRSISGRGKYAEFKDRLDLLGDLDAV